MIFGPIKMRNDVKEIGKSVIELQIKALKKLKHSINDTFDKAVRALSKNIYLLLFKYIFAM